MTTAIEVQGLTKQYAGSAVVRDVSFTVERGEIFGIIGPNGAGKTTTVECIEGLRKPDAGHISVLGLNPGRDRGELRERLGVQLQDAELPERLRAGEALRLYSSFSAAPATGGAGGNAGPDRQAEDPVRQAVRRPAAAAVHRSGPGRRRRWSCWTS